MPERLARLVPDAGAIEAAVAKRVFAECLHSPALAIAGIAGHEPAGAGREPRAHRQVVRAGSRLSQIRFRAGPAQDDDLALVELQAREKLVSGNQTDIARGIALSVDLAGSEGGLVGYRAKRHTGVVDVDAPGSCAILDFWEPIDLRGSKRLILDPDQFYILASKGNVEIPVLEAAEMLPIDPSVGEFRVHYAGFFDPGFGTKEADALGSKGVLEVRCHETPFLLEDGQTVARLVYEPLTERPIKLYGETGSTYQRQGLKLSKHFKPW